MVLDVNCPAVIGNASAWYSLCTWIEMHLLGTGLVAVDLICQYPGTWSSLRILK